MARPTAWISLLLMCAQEPLVAPAHGEAQQPPTSQGFAHFRVITYCPDAAETLLCFLSGSVSVIPGVHQLAIRITTERARSPFSVTPPVGVWPQHARQQLFPGRTDPVNRGAVGPGPIAIQPPLADFVTLSYCQPQQSTSIRLHSQPVVLLSGIDKAIRGKGRGSARAQGAMMLTYSFPALILGVLETGVALTLIGPLSLARPSMQLVKLTTKPVGKTILGTLTAILSALLLPPLWELFSMKQQRYQGGELGSLRYRYLALLSSFAGDVLLQLQCM